MDKTTSQLPEWVEQYGKSPTLTSDEERLQKALAVAWEALAKVKGYSIMSDPYSRDTSLIMEDAMSRIRKLGE